MHASVLHVLKGHLDALPLQPPAMEQAIVRMCVWAFLCSMLQTLRGHLNLPQIPATEQAIVRMCYWALLYGVLQALKEHLNPSQIPATEQAIVRMCYWAYLGFLVAVLFNLFGSLVALCAMGQASGRLPAFFLAAVYASAGIPGAWILWWGSLRRSMQGGVADAC